ncbi:MAG: hypothetical protein KDJ65_15365 [Anaerolineae bacterium]|nr:hypothetical protein [Anaerolineae bacterium]
MTTQDNLNDKGKQSVDLAKKRSCIASESGISQELSEQAIINRRHLLRVLAATTGGVVLANIPTKWAKPNIEAGLLPAHAQASGPVSAPTPLITPTTTVMATDTVTPTATATPTNTVTPTPVNGCTITSGTFNVELTWDTDANLELHIYEGCSNIDVAPVGFGGPVGVTIHHLGDAQGGVGSSETITQINTGVIATGTHSVHPGHVSGTLPTNATLTITTDTGITVIPITFTSSGYLFGLADITFPGGTVTSLRKSLTPKAHP